MLNLRFGFHCLEYWGFEVYTPEGLFTIYLDKTAVFFFSPWHTKVPVTHIFWNFVTGTFEFSRALFRKLSRARPKMSRAFFRKLSRANLKCHGHFEKNVSRALYRLSRALFCFDLIFFNLELSKRPFFENLISKRAFFKFSNGEKKNQWPGKKNQVILASD